MDPGVIRSGEICRSTYQAQLNMPKEFIIKRAVDFILAKLFKINDSPQKIALGVGLGVFSGLLPGTGPIAALFLAFIFKANRAAALFGSVITNTWLSFVVFILAVKTGSFVLKMNWQEVVQKAQALIKDFSWASFFKLSLSDVLLPIVVGYLIVGLALGIFCYVVTLLVIKRR